MESSSISSFASGLKKRLKGENVRGTLPKMFYTRHTVEVAKGLVGKLLVVRSNPAFPLEDPRAGVTAGRIVETEAYRGGGEDPASHSSRGETPRSSVMFGEPGVAYVYFIYGMYEMLNFVTEKKGDAGAVLIRAVAPVFGEELMAERRPGHRRLQWTTGPGKLCRAMGIEKSHNRESLAGPRLFLVDDGFPEPAVLRASPRVGISAGKEHFWRFFETNSPFVSRTPLNKKAKRV